MLIPTKPFLLIFAIALAALLLLSANSYWQNTRAVESFLRDHLRHDADRIAQRINSTLRDREASLVSLARTTVVREYLQSQPPALDFGKAVEPDEAVNRNSQTTPTPELPDGLSATITAFLLANQKDYGPISGLNMVSESLFRATITPADPRERKETPTVSFQTQDLPPNNGGPDSIGGDIKFISARNGTPLRALIEPGQMGPTVRYTVPVLGNEPAVVLGALVVDLKLDQLFKDAAGAAVASVDATSTTVEGRQTSRVVIILHHAGQIYYHSNQALSYQPINSAMPDFKPVAEAMSSKGTGEMLYESSNQNRWLASYRPLGQLDLSLAVAADYANALQSPRRALLTNVFVSVLIALGAALALTLIAQRRSGSIARLTRGAVAIARGELDQKLVVSSAENQLLAESMNIITARLREQIAREAESRQFDSFMRLSAMLTHDLKNAISGLSLLVSNMERQFDRAEFRADAMSSLKEATEKLQKLVTKLSEPVNTLSGEYQRPRPTDLVPLIQRVLNSVATTSSQPHEIEVQLPAKLVAVVEADRMEKVIENLVINSLEAMGSKRGALTIAAGASDQGKVFFSVSDTGPGMSKDFQERGLFHPFATTKPRGVGLGLYTCREVVRAHGGSIEVTSEPGVGTTFRVVLPSGQTRAQEDV